ncbi:MAG: CmcI family methyltransferase [Acidobacteriota bacterium]
METWLIVPLVLAVLVGIMFVAKRSIVASLEGLVRRLFHHYYYWDADSTWMNTRWMGVPLLKLPLDLWIYQEILSETRPHLIIETGTAYGGSALYFAHLMDIIGEGKVVSIDLKRRDKDVPKHPRIEYILDSSTNPDVIARVQSMISPGDRVMVVLDSDHSARHVKAEMAAYGPMVSKGCYMVVEDTNVGGYPVYKSFGAGPMDAIDPFLQANSDFFIDETKERFKISFNPRGWLKRRG